VDLKKEILICQHRTCLKDGSSKVLQEFRAASVSGLFVNGCGCLGLCGSGPIVLVADEQVYYWHIKPRDVAIIVKEHLKNKKVVKALLHRRLHSDLHEFD